MLTCCAAMPVCDGSELTSKLEAMKDVCASVSEMRMCVGFCVVGCSPGLCSDCSRASSVQSVRDPRGGSGSLRGAGTVELQ